MVIKNVSSWLRKDNFFVSSVNFIVFLKDAKLVPDEQNCDGEKLKQLAEKRYSAVIKLVGDEILG